MSQATLIPRPRSNARKALFKLCVLCASAVSLLSACPATSEEVRPPRDQFYFPTGLDLDPGEDLLFVASANSDLRYDSGTVIAVSLTRVDELVETWLTTGQVPPPAEDEEPDCEQDRMIPYTLICDEAYTIRSAVRIGNFVTDLRLQDLDGDTDLRLFAAVRGDPSLTYVDWDGSDLSCGGSGSYPECDDAHRLVQLRNDADLTNISDEPFSVFVDSANGYALVTHLNTGAITLADAPPDGGEPRLADALAGLFAADPVTGIRGAVGVAGRLPGTEGDRIYVTSRSEARVQTLLVERPPGGYPVLVAAEHFFLNRVLPSINGRGIAFSDDGSRAFIVNRDPPMLHIIDTSLDQFGVPRNEFLNGVELCPQASNLTIADTGRGDRVYVSCFGHGQVWSIDPRGAVVDAIIDVGRGPQGLVASPQRGRLYVSNNLEDTIAVIDIVPESVTQNRVVLRLGRTRQSEDD